MMQWGTIVLEYNACVWEGFSWHHMECISLLSHYYHLFLTEACYHGDGQSYRGDISRTLSGYTCQPWSSQCPHRHSTPDAFPELIDAGNACRNPGGQAPRGPWCYTNNSSRRWDYCDVPTCLPGMK